MTTQQQQIQAVIDALPNGFEWDWTMEFSGEYASSADEVSTLKSEESRVLAARYASDVAEASKEAIEAEAECVIHLERSDFNCALEELENAASKESAFGDAPSYQNAITLLTSMMEEVEIGEWGWHARNVGHVICYRRDKEAVQAAWDNMPESYGYPNSDALDDVIAAGGWYQPEA